jgi:hypothetical protein
MNSRKTFNKLFARLQLQARLREIERELGWDDMLAVLAAAVEQEFARHDCEDRLNTSCSNQPVDSSKIDNHTQTSQ